MSQQPKNLTSKIRQLVTVLKDYLWFLMLLAPLAMIPFLVVEKTTSGKKQVISAARQQIVFTQSVEVTTAQLAAIVAKPIDELLQMDVYVDSLLTAQVNNGESMYQSHEHFPQLLIGSTDNNLDMKIDNQNHAKLATYAKERS